MNASQESVALSERLEKATEELRCIQDWLISGDVDPRVLTDFRDTVNRLRTLAWAVQNYAELRCTQSAKSLTTSSLLSGFESLISFAGSLELISRTTNSVWTPLISCNFIWRRRTFPQDSPVFLDGNNRSPFLWSSARGEVPQPVGRDLKF